MQKHGTEIDYRIIDDTGLVHSVEKMANGTLTAEGRLLCTVEVDGKRYEGERIVRFRLSREKRRP